MVIKSVHIENYRALEDVTVDFDSLTVLVGPNGIGKSCILRALELFYAVAPRYTADDFTRRDTSRAIKIRVTYDGLTEAELPLLGSHVQDGQLVVEKHLGWPAERGAQKLYGYTRRNPLFKAVRSAGSAAEAKEAYESMSLANPELELPRYQNRDNALSNLDICELAHPEALAWEMDDGQFFGFKEVGQTRLDRFTRFILVPAVRDAALDAVEAKDSSLSQIMDVVVRARLTQKREFREFREATQRQYEEIVDPSQLHELDDLKQDLYATLTDYVPGALLDLTWIGGGEVSLPLPTAQLEIADRVGGHLGPVDRAGHGTQRALIFTLLQHLALAQTSLADTAEGATDEPSDRDGVASPLGGREPTLILVIEEPELYQHPNRQRHFAGVLGQLAGLATLAESNVQVVYTTHSPLMVGLDRFDHVRLLRPSTSGVDVRRCELGEVGRVVAAASGVSETAVTGDSTRSRLAALMTPWTNEGFFADSVVLVEGESDRAAIVAAARHCQGCTGGCDLNECGVAVIPCGGKNNLDRPWAVFRGLSLPVFVVWDNDEGSDGALARDNRRLLRLLGLQEEDWPVFVGEAAACLKGNLNALLGDELGAEDYERYMAEGCAEYGMDRTRADKNAVLVSELVSRAYGEGRRVPTLDSLVLSICRSSGAKERRTPAVTVGGSEPRTD